MSAPNRAVLLLVPILLVATVCQATITTAPTSPSRTSPSAAAQAMSVERARSVAEMYVDAYNAGDLDRILPLLAEESAIQDCDYSARARVRVEGKNQIAVWLGARFAEHDRFEVERIAVNPQTFGISILYRRRTSDSLRALGIAEDTTLAGTVIFFRGTEVIRINTGDTEHCERIGR